MKKSLIYLFGLGMAFLMTSCAMTTEVHFNKNYSGTYTQNIDFSGAMDIAKEFAPDGADSDDMYDEMMSQVDRDKMLATINGVDGISNAAFNRSDKSIVNFTFEFDNIESLNTVFQKLPEAMSSDNEMLSQAMEGFDGVGSMGNPQFSRDGKTITIGAAFPKDQLPEDALSELDEMGGAGMMETMMDMMDYNLHITFDKKVKAVKLDGLELISQDKHSVKARIDLGRFIEGTPYSMEVRN
jgi:hypothetical protein